MPLTNELPELTPDEGEVADAEVVVEDEVLVKAFALGPGAAIDPHEHDVHNVFHVLRGTATVLREAEAERVEAPGVVYNAPGRAHGLRNETDAVAVVTASLCPMPG